VSAAAPAAAAAATTTSAALVESDADEMDNGCCFELLAGAASN